MVKSEQLQLRVSRQQKMRIKRQAALAGQDVSKWVLNRLLPPEAEEFQSLVDNLQNLRGGRSQATAEIHDYLVSLSAKSLESAVHASDLTKLPAFESNYVAAMVEQACVNKRLTLPTWLKGIAPLASPWFASELTSLRLHLLTSSPPPFRRRNLFVDSTLGDRI